MRSFFSAIDTDSFLSTTTRMRNKAQHYYIFGSLSTRSFRKHLIRYWQPSRSGKIESCDIHSLKVQLLLLSSKQNKRETLSTRHCNRLRTAKQKHKSTNETNAETNKRTGVKLKDARRNHDKIRERKQGKKSCPYNK